MNLYQLVYSSSRTSKCTDAEIEKILVSCKKNNPGKNITGVLLHSENFFIQYLEGDKDIIKLYDLIKNDPRHARVVLLSYGPLKERIFPSWHMGFKDVSKNELARLTEGSHEEKKTYNAILRGEKIPQSNAIKLLTRFFNKTT